MMLGPWHSGAVTESSKNEPKENLVALSQYRARLARGQRARRADELWGAPDPQAAIRALPPDEFYYVIHELGFPEAMEILVHGTAEQVQTVLDFSVWDRDRVALEKSDEWLAALVEAPPETLGKWAQGIDVELLALLLRKRARIYDVSLEDAPDNPEGVLWDSPDRLFTLEFIGEPEQVRVTQHLVDSLYRYSPVMMRRLLVGMRADDDAELEETAYRWRSGRMADLGFVDFYEALIAYQELDPTSVRIEASPAPSLRPRGEPIDDIHLRLPLAVTQRLSGKTPFARAVGGLQTREETADLHFALVALCNRVLAADRISPSDEDGQSLLCIRLQMELLEQDLPEGEGEWKTKLREAREMTERTILEMRRLISALSPAVLEQLGLGAALRQLVNRFQRLQPNCHIKLHLAKMGVLPQQVEVISYRLLQECFNNIGKHSGATHVNISLASADGKLRLVVDDNGVGFNIDEALAKRESFGLSGMRERVALLGGEFHVESRTEGTKKGTKISIELPISK